MCAEWGCWSCLLYFKSGKKKKAPVKISKLVFWFFFWLRFPQEEVERIQKQLLAVLREIRCLILISLSTFYAAFISSFPPSSTLHLSPLYCRSWQVRKVGFFLGAWTVDGLWWLSKPTHCRTCSSNYTYIFHQWGQMHSDIYCKMYYPFLSFSSPSLQPCSEVVLCTAVFWAKC